MGSKMSSRGRLTVMNFSGVYGRQSFYEGREAAWLDCSEIPGTNCYCDPEAEREIKGRIGALGPEGIHFLDSGNYHYLSKLWTDMIREPFELLVFDNHTDMQPPMFGDILSCGGWVQAALEENSLLRRVTLIGPPARAFEEVSAGSLGERLTWVSREEILGGKELQKSPLPLYISIDKDVLSCREASTNWDQGEMSLETLSVVIKRAASGRRVIGWDVCGEDPERMEEEASVALSDRCNRAILEILESAGAFGDGE